MRKNVESERDVMTMLRYFDGYGEFLSDGQEGLLMTAMEDLSLTAESAACWDFIASCFRVWPIGGRQQALVENYVICIVYSGIISPFFFKRA